MRFRRRSRSEQLLDRIVEAPWWQRATAVAVPAAAALGTAAYAGRRRIKRGIEALRGVTRRSATA
jgi:hypothetical protein